MNFFVSLKKAWRSFGWSSSGFQFDSSCWFFSHWFSSKPVWLILFRFSVWFIMLIFLSLILL
jgi:hypothetical protein